MGVKRHRARSEGQHEDTLIPGVEHRRPVRFEGREQWEAETERPAVRAGLT